jgi:23S rRNA (uracil1939-C5)-methyltransferase
VSCNPEALARDLGPMVQHGYRVTSVQPVDMFPHTAHVETVVVLDRKSDPV